MEEIYLDLDNLQHDPDIHEKLWRESYYFNMTDPESGISMISTIGYVPNRNRCAGFMIIMKEGRSIFLKPLISFGRPAFTEYEFGIKDLRYSAIGIDWRIRYESERVDLDLWFSPMNPVFAYVKEKNEGIPGIGHQHYEQFGTFEGRLNFYENEIKIGPCLGHRDHSWGVRDWRAFDRYSLHCCAFSTESAFNLWQGWIGGKRFFKGYYYNGEENLDIKKCMVESVLSDEHRGPSSSRIRFNDKNEREYNVESRIVRSIPIPVPGAVVHEGIGNIEMDGIRGYGLSEHLEPVNGVAIRLSHMAELLREWW